MKRTQSFSIMIFAFAVTTLLSSAAIAQSDCNAPRLQDEVWEISSRGLYCDVVPHDGASRLEVSQLQMGLWQRSSFETLAGTLKSDSTRRTVLYTHGNWMTYGNTRGRSMYVYNRAAARAQEPIRFIAFTWPSQRSGRPVQDIREKANRAEVDAFHFAEVLNQIPRETPLGIIGYSFGARVSCGGIHLANGGSLSGKAVPTQGGPFPNLRISLIAPAFDRNWLAPNNRYGQALDGVEKLVNLYNSHDPILKRYRFIDAVTAPIAAGFGGITGVGANSDPRSTEPLASDSRIVQFDCFKSIGNTHDEMSYYCECPCYVRAIDNVLGR